jgi:branched-chain amino acid transport system ATP-binding protein
MELTGEMNLLDINRVTKAFGGLLAVNEMDLVIEQGKIYGLIGPNGAGKTTLFNIISGFYKPESGDIFFAGENVTHLNSDQLCHRGLVRTFQIPKMFPEMSVIDNVLIGALSRTRKVGLARSEAEEIIHFLGMETKKDTLAGSLRVHELKRLEIAKALATKPKLFLLDETMAGLNAVEQDQMIDLLKKVHDSGVTLFVVEHVMRIVANLCEHIVVMNYGEKIAEGRPQDVLKNEKVVKVYLGEED